MSFMERSEVGSLEGERVGYLMDLDASISS